MRKGVARLLSQVEISENLATKHVIRMPGVVVQRAKDVDVDDQLCQGLQIGQSSGYLSHKKRNQYQIEMDL